MRSCVALVISLVALGACSNNGATTKREDGPMAPPTTSQTPAKQPKVYIATPRGEVEIAVEVVDTWPKIEKGLMFREHLGTDAGMLFMMGYENDHAFYMRNTLIPLDMIFIKKDMTVGGVYENAEPRTETLRKVGVKTLYVLEVNGGYARAHGVIAGAKVRFEAMPPPPPAQ